jgi:hypothetical protein
MQAPLTFSDHLCDRPTPSGIDVVSTLEHFAIITYAVDPARFAGLIPPRFRLNTVPIEGVEKALVSVVPFVDVDFTSAIRPLWKFRMGQTNYRIYISDTQTGENCVWFLGTTLDSWTRVVPHSLWKLPWYGGKVQFDCEQGVDGGYTRYAMTTEATWAPADVVLQSEPGAAIHLAGFPNTETGLVVLTHPLRGYYHRRDGRLGSYHVWHDRLAVSPGKVIRARFGLLDRLGIVPFEEQQRAHSVLLDPRTVFTVYLPPTVVDQDG